eukprot:scaffold261_cov318-Chaetoceros_neogracile.AAC.16
MKISALKNPEVAGIREQYCQNSAVGRKLRDEKVRANKCCSILSSTFNSVHICFLPRERVVATMHQTLVKEPK